MFHNVCNYSFVQYCQNSILRLTNKKESADIANALRLTTSRIYNGVVCAYRGTNPIVYSLARFYFEVVIRERLSYICKEL